MTRCDNGIVYVNLTEVAKAFPSKNLTQIVNSQEIKEYCESLSKLQNYSLADLLIVKRGGNDNGTWAHQKVALRVAQKLSPDFAVMVDSWIEKLLTEGKVEMRPLTPAQQLLANAQLLVEMEQRQSQIEAEQKLLNSRQSETENKITLIEERIRDNGYMTVMGFANIQHLKIGTKTLQKLGKQCAAWCRRMGVIPEQTKHDKWGHVNTYPMQALRDVFKAAYPDKAALIDVPTYWG